MLFLFARTCCAVAQFATVAVLATAVLVSARTAPAAPVPTVLSFGSNGSGRTGRPSGLNDAYIATPIDATNLAGKSIVQVGAGAQRSLLLAGDGTVFSFGNNGRGATGLGTDDGITPIATPIDATNLAGKWIKQIAVGAYHSLLLADDGSVYSFGQADLMNPSDTLIATPIDDSNLSGKTVVQIDASRSHSLLLTDDGTVFSFGSNARGRTGLNTEVGFTPVATPIDTTNLGTKTIVDVAAGEMHSLLLADDGTIFSFGQNTFGATGLNTITGNTLVATPIDTTNLAGARITSIAAGERHSLLLADDGTVYSMGDNLMGLTGLNTTAGVTSVATEIDGTNLAGKRIAQIDAGRLHSLLLTDDGTVFSFGFNSVGEVGDRDRNTIFPSAIPIDATNLVGPRHRVVAIAGGSFYSLLIAVPEPGSGGLLLVGALSVLASHRRARRPWEFPPAFGYNRNRD